MKTFNEDFHFLLAFLFSPLKSCLKKNERFGDNMNI